MISVFHIFFGLVSTFFILQSWFDLKKLDKTNYLYTTLNYGKLNVAGVHSFNQIPKSSFKYFYAAAFLYSSFVWFLVLRMFLFNESAPGFFIKVLDFLRGNDRTVLFNPGETLLATSLLHLQISRRFYESNFMQIYSEKGKMTLATLVLSIVSYFFIVSANILNSQGFQDQKVQHVMDKSINFSQIALALLFFLCWREQYKTNKILVSLRTDKSGRQVSDKHFIPYGRLFNYISSPHFLTEIIMYSCLSGIMPKSLYLINLAIFVYLNQVNNANVVHDWYKNKFENYPRDRKVIVPFIY
ncbi:SRD5A3 family protein [Megaselia abdita]